ncbi:MAG TPA: hypothetical protein PKY05_04410, partial [Fibrobacteria bacterium]|nr:hypothetical protein [Fibrobacteria bacterium]
MSIPTASHPSSIARRLAFASLFVALGAPSLLAKAPTMNVDQAIESAIQGKSIDLATVTPATDSVAFARNLAQRLVRETASERRERIASLVEDMYSPRRPCQDRETMQALARGSATLEDRGSNKALDVLLYRCDPKVLASMPDELLGPLRNRPSLRWLELTTRVKPPGALPVLRTLAKQVPRIPEGSWNEAMAANGDAALESAYVDSFLETEDPGTKKDMAEVLRRIGTRKSLAALAQEMRTPLVYRLGRVFQVPVREHIAEQLCIAFPELDITHPINREENYALIEAFCERTFGTKW